MHYLCAKHRSNYYQGQSNTRADLVTYYYCHDSLLFFITVKTITAVRAFFLAIVVTRLHLASIDFIAIIKWN